MSENENGESKTKILSQESETDTESNRSRKRKLKDPWSSKFKFIVSLLGNSMGLGDIWRLPYLVYRNGGGAFLIPYTFFMVFCGIPLFFLELAMSQFSGGGPWGVWNICPLVQGIGLAFVVINWLAVTYLGILRAWVMEYLVNSFRSELPWDSCDNWWNTKNCYRADLTKTISSALQNYSLTMNGSLANFSQTGNHTLINEIGKRVSPTEEFWEHKVLRMSSGMEDFGDINWMYVLYLFITHLIIFFALIKGVNSMGNLMYITVIGPFILLIAVWIRALTIKGSLDGMLYFINPDFTHLGRLEVWIEAAFMAFYTLGPGWGCVQAMACHANFKGNCLSDATLVTFLTLGFGLLNGLVVFSVLGVMSEETGVPVHDVLQTGGFSLGFVAYPRAVVYFPFPQLWASIFFVILLLPSIDVSTILFEPIMCVLEEALPYFIAKRRRLLLIMVTTTSFLVSIPLALNAGVYIFQFMDWYVGTSSVMTIGIIEGVVFSWIYGLDRVNRDIKMMLGRPLPILVRVSVSFVIPSALLFLLFVSFYKYKPPTLGEYKYSEALNGIGWCISVSSILALISYGVYRVYRENGTLRKRLSSLLHYNSKWKPADTDYREKFEKSEKQRTSSFRKLVWFNLTGRNEWDTDVSQELEAMNQ